jgi:hypothetical protein
MPTLFRSAGFDADGGKVRIGTLIPACSESEVQKWLAAPGRPFLKQISDASVTEAWIQQTLLAIVK